MGLIIGFIMGLQEHRVDRQFHEEVGPLFIRVETWSLRAVPAHRRPNLGDARRTPFGQIQFLEKLTERIAADPLDFCAQKVIPYVYGTRSIPTRR
jgi:hypothetical protein